MNFTVTSTGTFTSALRTNDLPRGCALVTDQLDQVPHDLETDLFLVGIYDGDRLIGGVEAIKGRAGLNELCKEKLGYVPDSGSLGPVPIFGLLSTAVEIIYRERSSSADWSAPADEIVPVNEGLELQASTAGVLDEARIAELDALLHDPNSHASECRGAGQELLTHIRAMEGNAA